MRDVVVGVDQSETARRAAKGAAELAGAYGVNLHIVTCMHKQRSIDVGVGSDQFHSDWVTEGEQFLEELARSLGCEDATLAVRLGDPAAALCEEAERLDARTIVVGNRRVQGMSRVLGSVAQDVLRKAPCDVLIVNTTGTV
jgi:nucleotide-binding universal stress UspA family protein